MQGFQEHHNIIHQRKAVNCGGPLASDVSGLYRSPTLQPLRDTCRICSSILILDLHLRFEILPPHRRIQYPPNLLGSPTAPRSDSPSSDAFARKDVPGRQFDLGDPRRRSRIETSWDRPLGSGRSSGPRGCVPCSRLSRDQQSSDCA